MTNQQGAQERAENYAKAVADRTMSSPHTDDIAYDQLN